MSVAASVPPFPRDYRASGILLHVTSLPSAYGIGDLGPGAISWIDRLDQAGQTWWQSLPLGPTGFGNSPYQPLSSFAGNTLVISPDWLIEDGLLNASDVSEGAFAAGIVDYDAIAPFKYRLLDKCWQNFKAGARSDLRPYYEQFCHAQEHWLNDYALFRALKAKFGNAHYLEWPIELVQRNTSSLERMRMELAEQIGQVSFAQFLLFRQSERLKAYTQSKGLRLIGDMPFFVSADSSDVWANPEIFVLDEHFNPRFVAGVPPDYFSSNGQLWGNPVYNWGALRESGYQWWIDRLRSSLTHVDVVRLDHFRGFAAAWHVPATEKTAKFGEWVPGPGSDFFHAVENELGSLPFIAEDLGTITPDAYALRDQFQLPGMRVLQFAFDGHTDNPYLTENYVPNTVAYTGTHDNDTTRGWFEELPAGEQEKVRTYANGRGAKSAEVARAMMELAWSSVAALAITPLQDLLNLGREARMNIPGHPDGNWRWRSTPEMLSDPAFEWLSTLTKSTNRSKVSDPRETRALEAASKI